MAAPILPITAAAVASPTLATPTTGAVLVGMTAGLFAPPRVLLVPAGTRLPRGVHAVAVVAEPAAAGSAGRRGAMHWALAAAAAPGESAGDDDKLKADNAFYRDLEAKGAKTIHMLNWIQPPAARQQPTQLSGRAAHIKDAVEKAMSMAKANEDKFSCVKALLLAIHGVIDLARESAPPKQAAAVDKQWFEIMMLSSRVHDNKAMMESVTRAMAIAGNLLANAEE